jgi:hypothetical protein
MPDERDRWTPLTDGRRGYERLPQSQGEAYQIIDYDDSWEDRRVYTDEWGVQTVIDHSMGH